MDTNTLKKLKAQKSLLITSDGDPKAIAIMELQIATAEIERGEHHKALSNLSSAGRFIAKIDGWKNKEYTCPNCGERVISLDGRSQNAEHVLARCKGKAAPLGGEVAWPPKVVLDPKHGDVVGYGEGLIITKYDPPQTENTRVRDKHAVEFDDDDEKRGIDVEGD
jgi:predicted RNA-binding Zn-ribbon protein involved in translation (DUF1610 family)